MFSQKRERLRLNIALIRIPHTVLANLLCSNIIREHAPYSHSRFHTTGKGSSKTVTASDQITLLIDIVIALRAAASYVLVPKRGILDIVDVIHL
jgi:hypothetical protein